MSRMVADDHGRIIHPERYHNLPYAEWFILRDPTTGLVVIDMEEWVVIATAIPGVAPYVVDFETYQAKPLVRH